MTTPQCETCASEGVYTFTHDRSGYTNHGCRCEICSAANSEYLRDYAQVTWADGGPRCRKCAVGEEHDFEHGMNGYDYHKCSCEVCMLARYNKLKKYHQQQGPQRRTCKKCEAGEPHTFIHGYSAYKYHNCRCKDCVKAHKDNVKPSKKRWTNQLAEEVPGTFTGQEWTPEEDALVMDDDNTLRELAWKLQRSYASIRTRRNDLRLGRRQYQCKKCAAEEPHDFSHGTTGYRYHGCRCQVCSSADRELQRRSYLKRQQKKKAAGS